MKKENTSYLLKHISGFYVKTTTGFIELTEDKEKAKRFDPMEKNADWKKLYATGQYKTVKRTEVFSVKYEEVGTNGIKRNQSD